MLCGTDSNPHKILHGISHIQSECGKCQGTLCGILTLLEDIVMDMNNVMFVFFQLHDNEGDPLVHYSCLEAWK